MGTELSSLAPPPAPLDQGCSRPWHAVSVRGNSWAGAGSGPTEQGAQNRASPRYPTLEPLWEGCAQEPQQPRAVFCLCPSYPCHVGVRTPPTQSPRLQPHTHGHSMHTRDPAPGTATLAPDGLGVPWLHPLRTPTVQPAKLPSTVPTSNKVTQALAQQQEAWQGCSPGL